MAKTWDQNMCILVRKSPEAFVRLLLPQASYIQEFPQKLRNWQLEADIILEVIANEQYMLLHIEFQTYYDAEMPTRLLRYNVLIRSEYKLPVLSCVIYLLHKGNSHASPLCWSVPTGKHILSFDFETIEIGKLTPEEILHIGQVGLLPLLPLSKGGATRTVVQTMFQHLDTDEHQELAVIGFTLASLVFQRENIVEHDWLIRSFREMYDIIRDTPIYQEMTRLAREEGQREGGQKELRETLLSLVQAYFPELVEQASVQIPQLNNTQLLRDLIIKLARIPNAQEASQTLKAAYEKCERP